MVDSLLLRRNTSEDLEDPLVIRACDADPVVAHAHDDRAVLLPARQLDLAGSGRHVLDRVGEQVVHHMAELPGLPPHERQRPDLDAHTLRRDLRREALQRLRHHGLEIDPGRLLRPRRDLHQAEQIAHHLVGAVGEMDDAAQMRAPGLGHCPALPLEHQIGRQQDGIHGILEVVGDGVDEGADLVPPLLELGGVGRELLLRVLPLGDIPEVDDGATHHRILQAAAGGALQVPPGTVVMAEAKLTADDASRIPHDELEDLPRLLEIVGMNEIPGGPAHQLLRCVAEHARMRRARIPDVRLVAEDPDEIGALLDEGPEVLLAALGAARDPIELPVTGL